MPRPKTVRGWVAIAAVIGAVLVLGGCESADDPVVTGLVSRDYEETFEVNVSVDKVFVLVGTTEYMGQDSPANVTLDSEPAPEGRLQFRLRVVGLTVGATPRAITGYRWSGDTLRVWCGYEPTASWSGTSGPDASDPWQPPYLVPREVNIGSPAAVDVSFAGYWFE